MSVVSSKNKARIIVLLSAIPILIFFLFFFEFVSNIPFQDDYDGLLEPVTKFAQLPVFSWSGFIKILWTQDDERRIVIDRIIAILVYLINGHLDLRIQMFLGLLSLVGIFFLFYTIIRDAKLPLMLLVSCSLLLFTIQYYEAIFWGLIPCQQIIIYFFAFLAAYFLFPAKLNYLLLACLFAICASLSDVNGTFVLPVGIVLLLVQHRWKDALIWTAIVGSLVLLYYHNLTIPAFRPKLSDNIQHPGLVLKNLLVFSGLSFDAATVLPPVLRVGLIAVVGALLGVAVLYCGFLFIKPAFNRTVPNYQRWEITLWGCILHLSITMLAFAVGRALDGTEAVLISRYKYIGFMWLILIILLIASKLNAKQNRLFRNAWLGVSTVVFLFGYFQYVAPLDYYYKERHTDIYGWQYNRSIPSTPIYLMMRPVVDTVTVRAIRTGVYHLPEQYYFDGPYEEMPEKFSLTISQVGGHTIVFSNDSFSRKIGKQDGAYVILKSEKQQHIIPTKQSRYSLKSFLLSLGQNYYANGFSANIATAYLLPDQHYTVSVLVIDGDKKQLYPTGYQLQPTKGVVNVVTL